MEFLHRNMLYLIEFYRLFVLYSDRDLDLYRVSNRIRSVISSDEKQPIFQLAQESPPLNYLSVISVGRYRHADQSQSVAGANQARKNSYALSKRRYSNFVCSKLKTLQKALATLAASNAISSRMRPRNCFQKNQYFKSKNEILKRSYRTGTISLRKRG